jgi:hypothetical protein
MLELEFLFSKSSLCVTREVAREMVFPMRDFADPTREDLFEMKESPCARVS